MSSVRRSTGSSADRDQFKAASDFVGWYANQANKRAKIPKYDAYNLYLAYHEGIGGFQRGTYNRKKWLIGVSKKVAANSWRYKKQLQACHKHLKNKPWYRFW